MKTGLVVEDLPEAQEWLNDVLVSAFPDICVTLAASLQEARDRQSKCTFEIALIDIGLPDGSGIDFVDELNQSKASTIPVITSVFDDDGHIFSALRAGAAGYLLKDQKKADLVKMLQGIVDGQPPLSPAIARRVLGYFAPQDVAETGEKLTNREQEVLALIAKGYTIARVAALLSISRNTAAGYVKVIYRKLNISSRAEATLEASRRGIIRQDAH